MKIQINTDIVYLSSEIRIFKTEQFIRKTRHFSGIDSLISYIGEGVISERKEFLKQNDFLRAYYVTISDNLKELTFCFRFAGDIKTELQLNRFDIVFYDIISESETRKKDTRMFDFLSRHKIFTIDIEEKMEIAGSNDFIKIYILSNDNGVNFPMLSKQQNELVSIEDQNVLVQGVAGSGKTNICMNKLIYTALREYGGRVLYSTYSLALILDIKNKLEIFKHNIHTLKNSLVSGKVRFTDNNHIKAVENKLGIWIDLTDDTKISAKLDRMEKFLSEHIDLCLIENLAEKYNVRHSGEMIADENYFVKNYIPQIKDYQLLSKFEKIKYLSYEIIYKEIYGNIFGNYRPDEKNKIMPLKEYKEQRKDSFSSSECEIIYSIAINYLQHMKRNNLTDNNILSQRLLEREYEQKYSLVILDEVQDFTQINLSVFRKISRRMFCVGDALQMINPSYFSFSILKNMMFEEKISNVRQLKNNYRNSYKIENIARKLNKLNTEQFGVHNFVIDSENVDNNTDSKTYYIQSDNIIREIKENKYSLLTVVCSSSEEKARLSKILPDTEILTVSEIKGLERNSIILYDILSSNYDKWHELSRKTLNRKTSDENSVYRYYFNLFYVAITRAKQNLYVIESKEIDMFRELFSTTFDIVSQSELLNVLAEDNITSNIALDEYIDRIDEFLRLFQFDNAEFVAGKIEESYERQRQLDKIQSYKEWYTDKDYRKLGINLWKAGFSDEARTQFRISGDEDLIELMDACQGNGNNKISGDVVEFLPLVSENQVAVSLILDAMKSEVNELKITQGKINNKFMEINSKWTQKN